MEIKILGPGCSRCSATEKLVMDVLAETETTANVEKITDLMKIAEYGVMGTPAVVIDGQVKCVGKIPRKEDVKTWIGK
jgi:small redox-active disulfide protein 2